MNIPNIYHAYTKYAYIMRVLAYAANKNHQIFHNTHVFLEPGVEVAVCGQANVAVTVNSEAHM